MKQNQFMRLPKFVREYIDSLRNEISILKKRIVFYEKANMASNVYVVAPADINDNKVYLEERTTIYFTFLNGRKIRVLFLERNGELVLDVNGDNGLLIKPQASNSCHIKMEE